MSQCEVEGILPGHIPCGARNPARSFDGAPQNNELYAVNDRRASCAADERLNERLESVHDGEGVFATAYNPMLRRPGEKGGVKRTWWECEYKLGMTGGEKLCRDSTKAVYEARAGL